MKIYYLCNSCKEIKMIKCIFCDNNCEYYNYLNYTTNSIYFYECKIHKVKFRFIDNKALFSICFLYKDFIVEIVLKDSEFCLTWDKKSICMVNDKLNIKINITNFDSSDYILPINLAMSKIDTILLFL